MRTILVILFLSVGAAFARVPVWPLEPGGGGGGSGTVTSVGATSANAALVIGGSPIATSGTFTFTLDADLDQIAALADPGADRGVFWDDSAGAYAFLEFGSGLTLTGTTLTAASLGDGDKGDITVSGTGTVWTIDTQAVTFAKIQNIATSTFIGRTTAGTGVPEELSVSTVKTMLSLTGTNSGDVTLAGTPDYITISGQVITRGLIDLATDTTGLLAGTSVSFSDTESNFAATTVDAAIVELNSVDGSGPNSATGKVDWSQLQNVPAGFSDGTDDSGGGGGADADAIHDNVSGEIAAITEKTLPVGADLAVIEDSAASNSKKRIQLANLETLLEAVMDLNQLQGAITDAQVPDSITVNTANAGDSATAFFTTGQIERARGGTGADTSAYGDGLIGSLSAGTTVDVDTMSELETAIGGVDILAATEIDTLAELNTIVTNADLVPQSLTLTVAGTTNEITSSAGAQDLTTNRTWTLSLPATIDLGGKTSFEIPNSAAPTVDAFGEIAGDSNLWGSSKGAPVFFDGTAAVALVGTLVSDTPLDGQVPRFNSTGSTITWETFSATPGGSDTQLQYNDGGTLNGAVGLTYNDVTGVLTVSEISTTQLNATAFRILDNVDQSHAMVINANENLVSDISLNIDLDGVTRNLQITGNSVLSGTNTGDQTITLTGEVTGTGPGSFAVTLADGSAVSNFNLTTPTITGAAIWQDDVRQTFNPGTTNAGINVGSLAGDPSTPSNGDLWYDSTANELTARINGASVALGAGGGGGAPTDATYLIKTANGSLTNAEVVGATPGGELGGTWAAPTVDDTLSVDGWTMGASFGTTPTANDNDTSLATTAYVQLELTAYASDTVTFSNKTLTAPKFADLGFIADSNGNEMLIFDLAASAVNELTIGNGATGFYPQISATGGDTNIGINFQSKGTGSYRFLSTVDRATAIVWLEDTSFGTNYIEVVAPATDVASNVTLTLPETTGTLLVSGGAIGAATATTASAGDNDTSVATTAFVNTAARGGNTGTHASPSTTNPLTLTFDAIMQSVWYGVTGEIDLPAAANYAGRAFVVYNTGAFTITLDPNSSEVIVRDGTVQTGGVSMTLSSGAGNYVALISDGARWITLGYKGTLAVGS